MKRATSFAYTCTKLYTYTIKHFFIHTPPAIYRYLIARIDFILQSLYKHTSTHNNIIYLSEKEGMETKRIQSVIKMAVVIVFVGYVFIWVILPTNLYKKDWLLKVRANTMSTYFGTQGFFITLNFLILSHL